MVNSAPYPCIKKPLSFSNDRGFSFYFNLIFEISYFSNQFDSAVLAGCWQSSYFFNLNGYDFFWRFICCAKGDLGNSLFSKGRH